MIKRRVGKKIEKVRTNWSEGLGVREDQVDEEEAPQKDRQGLEVVHRLGAGLVDLAGALGG